MRYVPLFSLFMVILFQAVPVHAVEWSMAPAACLPDRAVRWETAAEMEPCHCPPQDMCPEPLELGGENIEFFIEWEAIDFTWQSGTIKGTDVPEIADGSITLEQIFAYNSKQLRDLLHKTTKRLLGVGIKGGGSQENSRQKKITIQLGGSEEMDNWVNNTLKLPITIAQQCCDSICPQGTVPEITEVEIIKPRDPDEGISLNSEGAEILQEDVTELLQAVCTRVGELQEHGDDEAANMLAEAWGKVECVQCYLMEMIGGEYTGDEIVSGTECLATNREEPTTVEQCEPEGWDPEGGMYCEMASEMLLHSTFVLEAIETMKEMDTCVDIVEGYESTLQALISMHTDLEEEKAICETEQEYITVQQFSCTAAQKFEFPREGCLTAGTQITMADGSFKNIEEITLGDKVLGNHGPAEVTAHSVFTQKTDRMYSINGGKAFFTVEHPVLTPKGWKSMDALVTSTKSDAQVVGTLRVGDVILMAGGKELKVTSIEEKEITGGISAYNLSVTGDGSFIANGFIMKSFKQMQMHY